jgi:cellulose synthase/poly-beta-1,6-N-acetylglucosamine synthase-like glycosyltransferase
MRQGEYYQTGLENSDHFGVPAESNVLAFPAEVVIRPIDREWAFLKKLGFSKPFLSTLRGRAEENGTTIEAELLADGRIEHDAYYGALARVLDLPFLAEIEPSTVADRLELDTQLLQPRMIRCYLPDKAPALAIVPSAREIAMDDASICSLPRLRQRVVVTTPSAMRQAIWRAGSARRVDEAANALFDSRPEMSARIVFSGSQGFLAGLALTVFLVSLFLVPATALLCLHVFLTSAFFLALWIRGLALHFGPFIVRPKKLRPMKQLPVYTVLVALYQEKDVARQLIDRLDKLHWPRSRLDIKLICEAGDSETIAALRAQCLRPEYEIIVVPNMRPKTKPKALNYGLAGARGDYLVIYDAEDRPHPDQLLEAYQRFQTAPDNVACLQAPLVISNAREGWLSGLFALEYSALFRRLLPLLGDLRMPMPLGGTSNHFRIDVLRAAGAWDPFNVTEDADLGLRLYRLGYIAEMITRPTLEDAPTEKRVWLGQRGRWLKGWMQTWLVLMRDPRRLTMELGVFGSIVFHVMITGMLLSALGHPLIVAFIAISVWHSVYSFHATPLDQFLFIIDGVTTAGSYIVFVFAGRDAMTRDERKRLGLKWLMVPIYWLMISYAAWQALIELRTNPFFWKKTPHKATSVPPNNSNI